MVHNDAFKGQNQDRQGCHTARPGSTNTHVQFPRIQRLSTVCSLPEEIRRLIDLQKKKKKKCLSDSKVVYRRYASLFFVTGITSSDNELATLEIIHRYVEVLDRYFGNVSGLPRST